MFDIQDVEAAKRRAEREQYLEQAFAVTHDEKVAIAEAARRNGGGFVASLLGESWIKADSNNDRIIREAFPHYIVRYKLVAQQMGLI